jgi:hypothetical protein
MVIFSFAVKGVKTMCAKYRSFLSFLIAVVLISACATEQRPAASLSTPDDAGQGLDGLLNTLKKAGAQVELGDSVEQPFFSTPGWIVKINGADVQVFAYKSAEVMEADAAQISPDGGSIGTNMVSWMAPPHFFKSADMIVLYVGEDASILELLKSALGEQFAGR